MENQFTPEQKKAKERKTMGEVKELAKKENMELTDEQLNTATGGVFVGESDCSSCAKRTTCSRKNKMNCKDFVPSGKIGCVTPDTLVTLADGSQVAVKDLTDKQELLTWNFVTGKQDKAPILLIEKKAAADYGIIDLGFSDGSTVGVVFEHGFFDVDAKKYVYFDKNAEQYIGHRFEKSGKAVELVSVTKRTEKTAAYSPVTCGHICCYVNGMLSITGGVNGMFNYFEVDGMKYDEGQMQADIETYGLFTYEEFIKAIPVPERIFDGMNCQYLKIAMGKGLITPDTLKAYAKNYASLF